MLILLCAVIFAGHIIAIDAFSPKCDGVRMACIQFFVSFLLNGVIALLTETVDFSAIAAALPSLLYLGICSSGIAYTLQIVGQGMDNVNPAVASVILSLESVFGVIGGAVVYGEIMSTREYLGCAIVFAAVILSQLDFKIFKKKKGTN
jgi:drug/metabolite transporter (DMT)-like permease